LPDEWDVQKHIPPRGRASINVGLGKRKGVAQQFEAWLLISDDQDLDDVETKKNVGIIEEPEPRQTASSNSFLFVAIDGVGRPSEILASPRFYFDEDECVFLAADDVDLAAGASTKITIEDFVAVLPQKPAG
jgi:hypothetical protein